jgi:tetratricopeptide (TPR) repeat protein
VTNWQEEQDDALPDTYVDAPDLPEESETSQPKRRFGWFRQGDSQQERLDDLNMTIKLYPESASNYVLRGEWFEQQKQYELAIADYEMARQLASEQVATDSWGLVNQAVQDRAIRGLRRVTNRE